MYRALVSSRRRCLFVRGVSSSSESFMTVSPAGVSPMTVSPGEGPALGGDGGGLSLVSPSDKGVGQSSGQCSGQCSGHSGQRGGSGEARTQEFVLLLLDHPDRSFFPCLKVLNTELGGHPVEFIQRWSLGRRCPPRRCPTGAAEDGPAIRTATETVLRICLQAKCRL